jgi:probable phosphoglycerate mutase
MKLIIARHGETIENLNKICQHQTGGQLSDHGLKQIKKLALRLKNKKIDIIYSSEAKRAIDTCQEILIHHPNLKLNIDPQTNERYLGKLTGNRFPDDWDWENIPQDCEKEAQVCQRAKKFLDDIYQKHKNETVLMISHGDFILGLLSTILKKSFSELMDNNYPPHTSVSEFDIVENKNHTIHIINCTEHLK